MKSRIISAVLPSFNVARKVFGFALVCAAFCGTAYAGGSTPTCDVPEMDPGTLSSALTLFVGGVILLKNRLSRR